MMSSTSSCTARPMIPGRSASIPASCAPDDVVHPPDLLRRLALGDGARHVRPVPRGFVLREDVHDDRFARVERAFPDLVWIGGLRARRADRSIRRAAALEERDLDDRAQPLGGERSAVELENAILADRRAAERIDAELPRLLRRALGRLDGFELVRPLRTPALAEVAQHDELDAHRAQTVGDPDREVRREADAGELALVEEPLDDRRRELRAVDALGGELLRAVAVPVDHARRTRLFLRATLFERARDDDELLDLLERDDRVRREEPRGVVHVREAVAVRAEEQRESLVHAATLPSHAATRGTSLRDGGVQLDGPLRADEQALPVAKADLHAAVAADVVRQPREAPVHAPAAGVEDRVVARDMLHDVGELHAPRGPQAVEPDDE